MRSLCTKLVLSAIGLAAMFASPASAQTPHRHMARPQAAAAVAAPQSVRGIYDVVPNYNRYDPGATGGGSTGYNQMLHDDAW